MNNNNIQALIRAMQDPEELTLVDDFIIKACAYAQAVSHLEVFRSTGKQYMDGEAYRLRIQELDQTRSNRHNELIIALKILNRLAAKHGVPPIYNGPDDRVEIAEFSFGIVQEYFKNRKL